jgi:stearoyl-CoA desaturase (delta-9 desaturase)
MQEAPAAPATPGTARLRRAARVALAVGPLVAAHLALVAIPFVEFSFWCALAMLTISRFVGLGVTAGFHRLLAHRAFKTSRFVQFLLVAAGCAALQKGPLWWVAQHRRHHAHSDTEGDPHSPVVKSFLHAHLGWLFHDPARADAKFVRDLAKYPELVWLDRLWVLPGVLVAGACYALLGWPGVVYGYCLTVVLVAHVTFGINSFGHRFGRRRFETPDDSRNNAPLGVLALGEGWHNNHHHHPRSARHGLAWWEHDETYLFIRLLAWLRLARDVKLPPPEVPQFNPVGVADPVPVSAETATGSG